ncbi:DegV family protein [Streptococcus suis]
MIGGRISKEEPIIGGLVNIKTILALNAEGKIEDIPKNRGRKNGIKEILNQTFDK